MRGAKVETGALFSYLSPEERVPKDHPLRAIRVIVDRSLVELDGHFNQIYSDLGRPSIPPEQLLRALLLQVFYSVRSERQLIEQLEYNLLFRWFVGLDGYGRLTMQIADHHAKMDSAYWSAPWADWICRVG